LRRRRLAKRSLRALRSLQAVGAPRWNEGGGNRGNGTHRREAHTAEGIEPCLALRAAVTPRRAVAVPDCLAALAVAGAARPWRDGGRGAAPAGSRGCRGCPRLRGPRRPTAPNPGPARAAETAAACGRGTG